MKPIQIVMASKGGKQKQLLNNFLKILIKYILLLRSISLSYLLQASNLNKGGIKR